MVSAHSDRDSCWRVAVIGEREDEDEDEDEHEHEHEHEDEHEVRATSYELRATTTNSKPYTKKPTAFAVGFGNISSHESRKLSLGFSA